MVSISELPNGLGTNDLTNVARNIETILDGIRNWYSVLAGCIDALFGVPAR
jgi:hypothetical protein